MFGDSLSDTGNAYIATLHTDVPSPPYYDGRFSNGPAWVEDFAANFGLRMRPMLSGGTDFAVGGAKASSSADRLPYQADLFLLLTFFSTRDPAALYIVFGGGNDIRSALKETDPAPALAYAALSIRGMIEHLSAHGASNFLVSNVPNRSRTPAARERGTAPAEKRLTEAYNAGLDAALHDLPSRLGLNLVRDDFWSAVERALSAPEKLGFSNISDPCLTREKAGYRQCRDPRTYAFWDTIHPTERGHRFLAAVAIAAYRAAVALDPAPTSVSEQRSMPQNVAEDSLDRAVLTVVRAHLQ